MPEGTERRAQESRPRAVGASEETQPQATEIRKRTQELVRWMRRAPGAPGEPRPTYISPRAFWRALRDVCPEFDNTRPHDAPAFFLSLRGALARVPGDDEPSPAFAAWPAEPKLQVTENTTCANRVHGASGRGGRARRPLQGRPPHECRLPAERDGPRDEPTL